MLAVTTGEVARTLTVSNDNCTMYVWGPIVIGARISDIASQVGGARDLIKITMIS